MIYEPTAWYSYAQFSDIFNRIPDLDDYENVLFQIELWKARGKVPAAIHATYLLLNVILCDRKSENYESNIRDLYAMSIIRTVNLLLDQEQDSLYAKSMILMGKEANLPETIIKCRHRCSHGDIPDVESLRLVCRDAVNYIYKKYWVNQYHLINSRLNDDYQYSFLVFSSFLICRSGMDADNKSYLREYFSLGKKCLKNRKGLKYLKNSKDLKHSNDSSDTNDKKDLFQFDLNSGYFKSVMEACISSMSLVVNKRNLSISRRLNSYLNRNNSVVTRQTVELFNFTTKKLLNSCVHEDIFISVFVEYVFCNHKPEESQLFFLFLFYTLSLHSFNFTLKLVAHMFNYILETNDMFTDLKTHYKDSTSHRVKLYRELMTNFNKDNKNKNESNIVNHNNVSNSNLNLDSNLNTNSNSTLAFNSNCNSDSRLNSNSGLNSNSNHVNHCSDLNHHGNQQLYNSKYDYQEKVNDWLLELVHYGISLKNRQFSHYHLKYLKIIKVLPKDDYEKMLNYEYTALSRILVAVDLLSSLLLLKVSNQTTKVDNYDWRSDKLSYLINISKSLKSSRKYEFQKVDEEEKNKMVMESREKSKDLVQELNKNLIPGTMWDNQQCKVVQTFPLDDTCQVSTHCRTLSAFERIRSEDFIKYIEGNKKREKIQSQMCNINRYLESGNSVQLRVQKKLFKIVSLVTNHFKSMNNY